MRSTTPKVRQSTRCDAVPYAREIMQVPKDLLACSIASRTVSLYLPCSYPMYPPQLSWCGTVPQFVDHQPFARPRIPISPLAVPWLAHIFTAPLLFLWQVFDSCFIPLAAVQLAVSSSPAIAPSSSRAAGPSRCSCTATLVGDRQRS